MHIMTKDGWKALSPRVCSASIHVPSLLEVIGIDLSYNAVKAMADYCNSPGRGVYFTYKANGECFQSRGAINPLHGMYHETQDD